MSEICSTCGLPKELCVCETIAKESQKIIIRKIRKKFGKLYTIIEGMDTSEIDMKELTKKLKNTLACGGTFKTGTIELQGDHLGGGGRKVKAILVEAGFSPETIEVDLR